jgi:hypothetical protein
MLKATAHIIDRLRAADRVHQRERGGGLFLRNLKYCWGLVLVIFALDVVWHLNPGWRIGLGSGIAVAGLTLTAIAARIAFLKRNRLEHIARFLEERDPNLGSRLINLLQLEQQTADPKLAPFTQQLARQAVGGYEEDLQHIPLEQMARTGANRRQLWSAVIFFLLFGAVLVVLAPVTRVELARFLDPHGDHPPFSFTRLEITDPGPAGTNVLYGKGFVVKVKSSGHQPKSVYLTAFPVAHPTQNTTLSMFDQGGAAFNQLLDNIREDMIVVAHTKDRASVSRQSRINVVLTPQLEKAFVQITPPKYTGLTAEEKPYHFKGLQALEGSEIRFRLQSNRPLRDGWLEFNSGEPTPERVPLARSIETEVMGILTAKQSGRLRFGMVDIAGLPTQQEMEGALAVTHDLPPEVRITDPERDLLVAIDFKLQAHIEASDDYGLHQLRIHKAVNGVYPAPTPTMYDPPVRNSHETVDFDFGEMGLTPGDEVSLFAEAIDNCPQEHLARSQVVKFTVISVEDYNNLLRREMDLAEVEAKYTELQEDLAQLIEDQKNLAREAEALEQELAKAGKPQSDDLARKLDDLLAKQNELNHKLDQHAERMDQFVRDTPLYDIEREFQQLLRREAEKIRASTSTNNAVAKAVGQRSVNPDGSRKLNSQMLDDFSKAAQDQVARLGGVQEETQEQVVKTLQEMGPMQELQKDFNLFETLYEVQKELAAQSQAYNRAGELSREDQLALKELAAQEKEVGDALEGLQDKLREDAAAAEENFPKAAQSGRELADKLEQLRLGTLARQATSQMLAGNGERSFRMAERLRDEMGKLFSECQGGNCPGEEELDGYLTLKRSQKGGRSFAQMGLSQKFGKGSGSGFGAEGAGLSGNSGFAMSNVPRIGLLGNERKSQRGQVTGRQSARAGKGAGPGQNPGSGTENAKADTVKGLNPINRQSGAVSADTVSEEYSDLVDSYFKAITTKKKP